MQKGFKKIDGILLILVMSVSIFTSYVGAQTSLLGSQTVDGLNASADIPRLANEDTIVDPRGQTVKQAKTINLSRSVTLDLIQPIDWSLKVFDFNVVKAKIPMDLDLSLGMNFPLNVETSYDPYDVHPGSTFPFVVDINNVGCTPSVIIGVDFEMDFAGLNFNFLGLGNLLEFTSNWGKITYNKDFSLPIYGLETKLGNWLSYDILDKYYSLSDLLHVNLDWDKFAIKGGIGVNIQYNLYSYVTAIGVVDSDYCSPQYSNLRWDEIGAKTFPVSIDPIATHGEVYSVQVGDWVYHVAHDVTFTVWADIGLEVLSLDIIKQKFDYAYTLNMGELTFPEKNNFKFQSYPEILAGKSVHGATASWTAIGFDYGPNGGNFQAFDYKVTIPQNDNLKQWLQNMDVDFSLGARINIDFPFNMKSYYNARKVANGSYFDYNVLVDSVGAAAPSINYNVDFMLDLRSVNLFGMQLGKYQYQLSGDIFSIEGLGTPFGRELAEIEITKTIGLDSASKMLNDYISNMIYGINPDIQFRAWILLQLDAYMTGSIEVTDGATVLEATEFRWDSQFDTQTSRIFVPAALSPGQTFNVTYKNLVYHLEVTPGIKLGVSVLGGIVGFEYPFFIPGVSQYLKKDFTAPEFKEVIQVNQVAFEVDGLVVNDPIVNSGDNIVTGNFDITNIGTVSEQYVLELVTDNLPTGTTASWAGGTFPDTTNPVSPNAGINKLSVYWTLTLGSNAHTTEYEKNKLQFLIRSNTYNNLTGLLTYTLDIRANPGIINTKVTMESEVDIKPGVGVIIPVLIENKGQVSVNYGVNIVGDNINVLSSTPFSLAKGEFTVFNYEIFVPAEASSTAGDYPVTVTITQSGAANIVKTLTYTVPEFMNVGIDLVSADEQVEMGDGADFNFILSNNGNIDGKINASIVGIENYRINGIVGKREINLLSGATGVACLVSFASGDLQPGLNSFQLVIENLEGVLISQNFTIVVDQVALSVQSDGYQYTNTALNYKLTLTNNGPTMDKFNVEIVGLDSSAYILDSHATDLYIAGGGSSFILDLTIRPTDITKVYGGTNGFGVKITSDEYEYSAVIGGSGVVMPSVYNIKFSEKANTILEKHYYNMTFTIQNQGNLGDLFNISIQNLPSYISYTIDSEGLANGADNQIQVRKGEIIEITVKFNRNFNGAFKPVINVYNSENEKVASYSGSYWNGLVYSPAFLITILIASIAVASSLIVYGLYSRGIIVLNPENMLFEKLRNVKTSISMKLSSIKTRTIEKLESYKASRVSKQFNKETASTDASFTTPKSKILSPKEKEQINTKSEEELNRDYWHLDED